MMAATARWSKVFPVVEQAMRASPALIRSYQDQKLLPSDKDAVNLLLAKTFVEVINAGASQLQLAEEWKTLRNNYAELRATSLELAPLAKQRPCLFGLGASFDVTDDGAQSRIVVVAVAPNGPSDKAGLRQGDRIVAVNGEQIVSSGGLNRKTLSALDPAAKGITVSLKVTRNGKSLDIAIERTAPLNNVPDLLGICLAGSCDGALDADELRLVNASGMELTNCTLLVTLATDAGNVESAQVRQHIHFVKRWPGDQKLFALYHNGLSPRIIGNESFSFVKRVSVQIFTDQFQGTSSYSYWNSPERKKDLKRYCESDIDFRGKYLAGTDGLIGRGDGLYQSDAGVRCWLHQVEGKAAPRLSPREIEVVLHRGDKSVSAVWDGAEWQGGGVAPFKTFLSQTFNSLGAPDAYDVRLRFHGSDYEHVFRFRN